MHKAENRTEFMAAIAALDTYRQYAGGIGDIIPDAMTLIADLNNMIERVRQEREGAE